MRAAKSITIVILVAVNILFAAIQLLSSFCGTLPPQTYPKLSVMPLLFPFALFATTIFLIVWPFVKWKLTAIPLLTMILTAKDVRAFIPFNFPCSAPEHALKFMSFNVGNNKREINDEFIAYLLQCDADIIGMQEYSIWSKALDDESINKVYPYIFHESKENNTALLSKYPILSTTYIKYESLGNSSHAHEVLYGNDTILIVNNHLQSYSFGDADFDNYNEITKKSTSMSDREKDTKNLLSKLIHGNKIRGTQVETVAKYVDEHKRKYTIVCGDFNEPVTGYAHYVMTNKLDITLHNAFTLSGNGTAYTYSNHGITYRIDHILISDSIKPYQAGIDESCTFSDHFPIYCQLELR